MRKKTTDTKDPAVHGSRATERIARPEARARTPERRGRRAEVCAAPADSAAATAEAAAPRQPEPRPPMPFELARMLEEETWWRVVRVQSAEPARTNSGAKSSTSSRITLAKLRRPAA